MQFESQILDDQILKISLDGRLDIEGTQKIDLKFTALTNGTKAAILIDMNQVSFLASIGIRTLLSCAKAASAKGGMMVLFNPQPLIRDVLETSGVATLLATTDDLDAAKTMLQAIR